MYDFLDGNEKYVASETLRKNVRRNIMKNKIENVTKTVAVMMLALVMMFTAAVNVSPDLAFAMSDVPILGDVVRVITLNRYEKKIGGSEAEIVIPKIEGLENEELMDDINEALGNDARVLIEEFEKDAVALMEEFGDGAHSGVGSNYEVRTDNEDYFVLDVYFYNTVGSSLTVHKFYTIDKASGELVKLEDLFIKDCNYVEVISEIVKNEMIRLNKEEGGMFWVEADEYGDGFAGISADNKFFINDDGDLVICFDKYAVAAGAQGSPEFVIEKELIKDILK